MVPQPSRRGREPDDSNSQRMIEAPTPHGSTPAVLITRRKRQLIVYAIAAILVALTITYRVLTMGGSLGGFENDQFVTLSQAQQVAMGEWPVRDFVDLGKPLTLLLSAFGQVLFGHTLLAEALTTSALIGISTATMFVLSWRVSGSISISLVIALLQMAMAPRFYNYPKLLAYAIAIPALWAYVERPTRTRLVLVAAAAVFAGLLRHDHGLYVGVTAVAAIILVRWRDVSGIVLEVGRLAALGALMTLPYLVFVQANDGIVHYARAFVSYASETAERTNLKSLQPSIDWSQPLFVQLPDTRPPARINIRWSNTTTSAERAVQERALGLDQPDPRDENVVNYALADPSSAHLEEIVKNPDVADTSGIDRQRFVLNDPVYTHVPTRTERVLSSLRRVRVLPGVLRADNAVPFLYALMYAVPILALLLVVLRPIGDAGGDTTRSLKILVLVVLALLVDRAFLRGNLSSRLADVTEPVGILASWAAVSLLGSSSRTWRPVALVAALLVLVLTALSVQGLEDVTGQAAQLGTTPAAFRDRVTSVHALLSAVPPVAAWPDDAPGMEGVAHYVNACTRPDDRVLAVGYVPELFFMAQRRFAAGHVWILPGFFNGDVDQRLMLDRIQRYRVPLALTVADPEYSTDYVPSFTRLTALLADQYRLVDTIDFGRGYRFRVLARRDLAPTGIYRRFSLPCFS